MELGSLVRIKETAFPQLNGKYGVFVKKEDGAFNILKVSDSVYDCVAHNLGNSGLKNELALYDKEIELVDVFGLLDELDRLF